MRTYTDLFNKEMIFTSTVDNRRDTLQNRGFEFHPDSVRHHDRELERVMDCAYGREHTDRLFNEFDTQLYPIAVHKSGKKLYAVKIAEYKNRFYPFIWQEVRKIKGGAAQ